MPPEHPWMKVPVIANMLGLTLGSFAIFLIGWQLDNLSVEIIGVITSFMFFVLFVTYLTIAIQDYIEIYPKLTRGWGIFRI